MADERDADPDAQPPNADPADLHGDQVVPHAWRVGVLAIAVILIIWFLVAWLVLDRHVLDAAGESVGTALALGIVVSLIGALRGSH